MGKILLAIFALLMASGCGSARVAPDVDRDLDVEPVASAPLRVRGAGEVAPGYEIRLSSLEDQSLNGKYRIDFDSHLMLPYNVSINAEGLTVEKLRGRVNEAYSKFFKTPPQIGVSVSEERYWIDVRGLVEKPGRHLVKRNTSLDEALSMSGGLQKNSQARYVRIQQGEGSVTIKLSDYYSGSVSKLLPRWQGGDIVFVQSDRDDSAAISDENAYIQVMGEVRNPGEYRYVRGADVYYYAAKAGGPTDKADLYKIDLIGPQKIEGRDIASFELNDKDAPSIRPGDMLLFHADKTSKSEKVITMAAGIAGILNTMLLIILLF